MDFQEIPLTPTSGGFLFRESDEISAGIISATKVLHLAPAEPEHDVNGDDGDADEHEDRMRKAKDGGEERRAKEDNAKGPDGHLQQDLEHPDDERKRDFQNEDGRERDQGENDGFHSLSPIW